MEWEGKKSLQPPVKSLKNIALQNKMNNRKCWVHVRKFNSLAVFDSFEMDRARCICVEVTGMPVIYSHMYIYGSHLHNIYTLSCVFGPGG